MKIFETRRFEHSLRALKQLKRMFIVLFGPLLQAPGFVVFERTHDYFGSSFQTLPTPR